jgi:3-dehydro-L-gulonate 2-dehydrogenase
MLDLLVSLLSEGLTSTDIGMHEVEHSLSQLFLVFNMEKLSDPGSGNRIIQSVLESITGCAPAVPGGKVFYPGQQTWLRRQENLKNGIPVESETWDRILQIREE